MDTSIRVEKTESYVCPICHTRYDTQEKAEKCMSFGKWRKKFIGEQDKYLWQWNIFKNKYGTLHAYIPRKIDPDYDVSWRKECLSKPVSVFNSFGSFYSKVIPVASHDSSAWQIVATFGITEGYEQYSLVPPLHKMRNLPEDVAQECIDVRKKALDFRKEEIKSVISDTADTLGYIAALCEPFLSKKYGDYDPVVELTSLGKTQLITDDNLYALKNYPQFGEFLRDD